MPTSERITPRRALLRGLVLVALLALIAAGVSLVRGATGALAGIGQPSPPRITQQLVVERLQTVARLVSSEMTLRDVVVYEQTRFGSTKRALLVVTGRVAAGIDLEKGTEVEIDSVARRITVSLPPAEIFSIDVTDVTTYDERAGLLNPFRADDRDRIQREVRAKLEQAARESGILQHADESAAKALVELLERDGYTVQIRRPPVIRRPDG
ncbi:MAG TPA: DUF4230 domain-containing protein [Gemmatimonadales bacterium]